MLTSDGDGVLSRMGISTVPHPAVLVALPDSAGFETFTRLMARASHLPVLVLSGLDDEGLAVGEGISSDRSARGSQTHVPARESANAVSTRPP